MSHPLNPNDLGLFHCCARDPHGALAPTVNCFPAVRTPCGSPMDSYHSTIHNSTLGGGRGPRATRGPGCTAVTAAACEPRVAHPEASQAPQQFTRKPAEGGLASLPLCTSESSRCQLHGHFSTLPFINTQERSLALQLHQQLSPGREGSATLRVT